MGGTRFIGTWIVGAMLVLILGGWLQINGFVSDSAVQLWSKAILQMDGPSGFKSSEALYPPLPFFVTMVLHNIVGPHSIPIPTLFAALVVGLFAALAYKDLRGEPNYRPLAAGFVVLLTFANPLLLFLVSQAPEMALLCLGYWIFAWGLVKLRIRGNAPDMMRVGVGLVVVGLSSSYGILICLAAIPFLAITAPPKALIASPFGTLLALVFPVGFAIGSLLFLGFVFDTPLIAQNFVVEEGGSTRLVLAAFLIAAYPGLLAAAVHMRAGTFALPIIGAVGTIGAAMALDFSLGYLGDPLLAATPLIMLGLIMARVWPQARLRAVSVIAVLAVAWVASYGLISRSAQTNAVNWTAAMWGQGPSMKSDNDRVADFLRGRTGVMLDAESHPQLIVALRDVDNLSIAGASEFELVMSGGRPQLPYIVVQADPDAPIVKDRVLQRFPNILDTPPRGYFLVFEHGTWRVFERRHEPA